MVFKVVSAENGVQSCKEFGVVQPVTSSTKAQLRGRLHGKSWLLVLPDTNSGVHACNVQETCAYGRMRNNPDISAFESRSGASQRCSAAKKTW